jgi:hypothetical protein
VWVFFLEFKPQLLLIPTTRVSWDVTAVLDTNILVQVPSYGVLVSLAVERVRLLKYHMPASTRDLTFFLEGFASRVLQRRESSPQCE